MPNIDVVLNGTDTNPWHKMDLTQNPFPQLARMETNRQVLRLQNLGGDPIPNTDYIRSYLAGFVSSELIELCVSNFRKGEMVKFTVHWKD